MKKLILTVLLGAAVLVPTVAHAASDTWYMPEANGKIEGRLYKMGSDKEHGQAATEKVAGCKNHSVRVKLYATSGGGEIPGSWAENTGKDSTWMDSYARKPDAWGSGHTTTPSSDPWKWLYLGV